MESQIISGARAFTLIELDFRWPPHLEIGAIPLEPNEF